MSDVRLERSVWGNWQAKRARQMDAWILPRLSVYMAGETQMTDDTLSDLASFVDRSTPAQALDYYAVKVAGYPVSEWADATGRSESAVRGNVSRYRKRAGASA